MLAAARASPPRRSPAPAECRPSGSGSWPASSPRPSARSCTDGSGSCNQEFGTLASWAVDVVNVLTGHLDVEGGAMFPTPAIATISQTARRRGPVSTGRWHTRVRKAPEVLGQAPLSCLAEEIATPGEGRVRALITMAGNPVLSAPDAGRLDAASPLLDAMISVDNWLNETSRHAHVILPGLSALEQPHCDEALWGFAVRSAARWSPASLPPRAIGRRSGRSSSCSARSCPAFRRLTSMSRPTTTSCSRNAPPVTEWSPPTSWTRRRCAVPTGSRISRSGWLRGGTATASAQVDSRSRRCVNEYPHGVDFGPMMPRIDHILRTASGDVELAHDNILGDLPRLEARIRRDAARTGAYRTASCALE